ncbi:adenosylcobinamide-phosphate synthase CbiB [Anaeromicropila herbilytica]|uniref:Cobalamin biosynthesis protein CobD n=1 Tax=Anaeromicropila herbilytica TaxID=2785025 RepID=A0A7R7EQ20_9FIRM|nr:adenosylcobinamide-phosphate synthase CbiB [Anaeromicropila herbilytica]BCN32965.1 cobalamin biosynthesis protein CobD [Anaeromicropila herbilytica]
MKLTLLSICIGFVLDLILGDPHFFPHPIRLIGSMITRLEILLRKHAKTNHTEYIAGGILVILVLLISTGLPLILLIVANGVHPFLRVGIEAIFCYQLLATKSLKVESMKVYTSLKNHNLEEARYHVSMIVGRDTKNLTDIGISKAAIETVAENTSDGSIAPLIYLFIGGAPLGFFYKAVNTMDSMIGYKNDKYLYFGRIAAKLDDILNYIPARISAYVMILASFFLRYDVKNAYRIYKRDRYNHASPNSAHTESVCAGALRIQLAGNAYYFGKLYEKPYIGDNLREIVYEDIKNANKLLYKTALLSFLFLFAIRLFIILLFDAIAL